MPWIDVWTAPFQPTDLGEAPFCDLLPEDEKAVASGLRLHAVRSSFIWSRVFRRTILASYTGESASELLFTSGTYGKPYLSAHPDLYFNVSHCCTQWACAVSNAAPVGIDIEDILEISEMDMISRQFFCPLEVSELEQLEDGARLGGFYRCWTRKEAFIKATGQGLSRDLSDFAVSLDPARPARLLWVGDAADSTTAWNLHSFEPSAGVVAALAWRGAPVNLRFRTLDLPAVKSARARQPFFRAG